MELQTKELVESAIHEASKIAEMAPPKYQQGVFQTVFNLMLTDRLVPSPVQQTPVDEQTKTEAITDNNDILNIKFDWSGTKIPYLRGVAQYLAIIEIALNKFNVDGISAKTIQQVLFQKFRVSKTSNAVSMSLMNSVGKYVDRDEVNGEYVYRITRNGIDLIRQEEVSIKNAG
jgi:hypothetical protein